MSEDALCFSSIGKFAIVPPRTPLRPFEITCGPRERGVKRTSPDPLVFLQRSSDSKNKNPKRAKTANQEWRDSKREKDMNVFYSRPKLPLEPPTKRPGVLLYDMRGSKRYTCMGAADGPKQKS